MPAVAAKPKPLKTIRIREDFLRTADVTVDRESGVIRNVKILGFKSVNGRVYTREALQAGYRKYEGAKVYEGHDYGRTPNQNRAPSELLGKFINVRLAEDGLRGDFVFRKSSEIALAVCEDAERDTGFYGFSPLHDIKFQDRDGQRYVTEIVDVLSIDLVTNPATTKNVREEQYMEPEPKPEQDAPAAPAGSYKADLLAAVAKLLDSEDPADMDIANKIMALLKKTSPAAAAPAEAPAEEQDEGDMKKGDEKPAESKKPKATAPDVLRLQEELKVRDLIEESGLKFAKPEGRRAFIKSLIVLEEAERKAMIEERKAVMSETKPVPTAKSNTPGGRVTESVQVPKTREEARKLITVN